jgi:hypothetical protein
MHMTSQWIDVAKGVAYMTVEGPVMPMRDFLHLMDALLVHPQWQSGMPIIQDIRGLTSSPPLSCVDEWRDYVFMRGPLLQGCRIAVVARGDDPRLDNVVSACGTASSTEWVSVQMFRDLPAALHWAQRLPPPS